MLYIRCCLNQAVIIIVTVANTMSFFSLHRVDLSSGFIDMDINVH